MGDESIWKKEISFGRKKKADAPAPDAPFEATAGDVPFWKKEISLSRKPKAEQAAAPVEAKAEEVPFWKKEVSLSRKPKAESAEPKSEQVPFWKKEISLGGKKPAPPPDAFDAPKPEQVPFWKKEITLSRKQQKEVERLAEEAVHAVAPPPEAERPAAPAPIEPELPVPVVEPVAVEPEPVAAPEPEPVAPEPVAAAPEPEPEYEIIYQAPPAPAASEPEAVAPGLEPLPEPPSLSAELEAVVSAAAPEPPAAEPFPAEPAAVVQPEPEPAPAVEPALAAQPEPEPEPWESQPALPPEPEPAPVPAAQTIHPPVPAAELPPLPAAPAEPKVPFWKKEIGGKKKPKAAEAPVAAAEPKVPFWKKEIGGKKKPKAAAQTAAPAAAQAAKVPFWKKEIGGKKKQAAAAAPKAKRSGPFWKLELPSLSLPMRSRSQKPGASGKKGGAKRVVGLKIGASQIAAARVTNNGVAELLQVARQPLDQGIVVGGELRDPDALAEQLKSFFSHNKLPKKNVRLGIASNRIGVRIFDVAGITDQKQLTNAIQFRAQEALPIPLDEAVLDYHVLSETVDDEGQPVRRILLVVAYRELVDRYIAACRKAGISLLGIDLEAFAVLRALAAPREEDIAPDAALVAVAVGHDRSTFAVSDGRVCEFTRVLEWGGAALNVALARALDLAPSEVEGIKRSLSLDPAAGAALPDGLTQEQWAASLDAVRKQLQSFARELVSSLQFYQNQPGSLGIGEIVLTGGTAHLPGLAEELQRLIGVRVRVGDPLARLKVAKKVADPEQLGSFAIAIGLGIED